MTSPGAKESGNSPAVSDPAGKNSIPADILTALRGSGLVRAVEPAVTPLAGGVSCDIWRVEDEGRIFAVKRALPKLRVEAEWFADVSRNRHEQDYLRYVGKFLPYSVPKILLSGPNFFAMEFLGDEYSNWKNLLFAGDLDPEVATAAGSTLGRIHRESWLDFAAERLFDTGLLFHALRIAPYLLAAADQHPDLAAKIHAESVRLASCKRSLVHGDYSPKNLMASQGRLIVLDCEVAWFGDPAFDLCFLVNHLLLKSLHQPKNADAFLRLINKALSAYRVELGEDKYSMVSRDSPALLLCLLLARVDGKSPVEYLTDPEKKDFVRTFVRQHLLGPPENLTDLIFLWKMSL